MALFRDISCEIRGSGLPGRLRMDIMCLAIPAKVIEKSDDGMLKATVGNGPTCLTVSGILLPEEVEIGDYIIIHAGFAMHKMEKTEAEESLRLFRELAQATGQEATF